MLQLCVKPLNSALNQESYISLDSINLVNETHGQHPKMAYDRS